MKLSDGNILHVLCTGTGLQQGKIISAMSAAKAWPTIRRCWINVNAGAPDIIRHDAGTNFYSDELRTYADGMEIKLKCFATKARERIGALKRRHAIVRSVYKNLSIDLPDISQSDRLSFTFRAVNDIFDRLTSICLTTLVFGVYPKLPRGQSSKKTLSQRVRL